MAVVRCDALYRNNKFQQNVWDSMVKERDRQKHK